ncbi:MAG TPA: hypothetical protein VGB33_05320 [Acidimicrobiia bacterium]|jgi:hypothetical protein
MTHRAVGFGRGFPRIWLLPILSMTSLLGLAVYGRFSRSIVADLVAWWPVWAAIAALAVFFRNTRLGPVHVAGLVPLLGLAAVGLFAWGHVAGWSLMPSASQRLVGPETGEYTVASLRAELEGSLVVSAGSEFLYQVEPIRRGGAVGIPGAAEQVNAVSVSVVLEPEADPGVYTYSGWELLLSPSPRWDLHLDGALDADLRALTITGLGLSGSGVVRLGAPLGEVPVDVHGSIRIVIPSGSPARVIGQASIPATWTLTANGADAPAGGAGWVFTVDSGATLVVTEG